MSPVSRRDFLKVSSVFLGATVFSPLKHISPERSAKKPNIIILVFDAMSANHLSIYGYPRKTTPNFERFAEQATVYHSNYAAANFTSPGTATILTGMDPWKHRAFNFGGLVKRNLIKNNMFKLLGDDYFTAGFSQNVWVDKLLAEFNSGLDMIMPPEAFSSRTIRFNYSSQFPDKDFLAYDTFDEFLGNADIESNQVPGSLMLGILGAMLSANKHEGPNKEFPYGKPIASEAFYYDNNSVFDKIAKTIISLKQLSPFLVYLHLYSPHAPYTPHRDFVGVFDDMPLVKKPYHKLSNNKYLQRTMKDNRDHYDEYITNVDAEFGNILDKLDSTDMLKNSFLIVASDHGEVFERGEIGHGTALLPESVIRTPLIISAPGQTQRIDINSHTCNTDLVPTMLHNCGLKIPDILDGRILPGLGGIQDFERPIFSVEAKENSSFLPIERATIALNRKDYKLIYYTGYEKYNQQFELYNIQEDPHELTNLFDKDVITASRMKDELLSALNDANQSLREL